MVIPTRRDGQSAGVGRPTIRRRQAARAARVGAGVLALAVWMRPASGGDRDVSLDIRLNTGGRVGGVLLGGDADVVLLECDGFPCAFGYDQLLADSAHRTRLAVLSRQRGARDRLTAADHYELGLLALRHRRPAYARRDFAAATRLDESYRGRGAAALDAFRGGCSPPGGGVTAKPALSFDGDTSSTDITFSPVASSGGGEDAERAARRAAIVAGYKRVGADIRAQVGSDLVLRETAHFLIWTDWARAEHEALSAWCEGMYASLARRFGVAGRASIFEGKCPVFCLRSRKRFAEVAGLLDGYDVSGALGYTRSDDNGHVHVVVCRQGGSCAARDAFAATLIHEGTHAFLHRYGSSHRLPMWVNEGLANYVADGVLGDRCPNDHAAAATARAVVRGGYDIGPVFAADAMLDARYYAVAHSLVALLIDRDAAGFVGMIDDLKAGATVGSALLERYGLTLETLERAWREAHR